MIIYKKLQLGALIWTALVLSFLLTISQITPVQADGTEELGDPIGITIAPGSGIVAAGVGVSDTIPATIALTVPANSEIRQVLLYWSGAMIGDILGSDLITVSGQVIQGNAIGGPSYFYRQQGNQYYFSAFRADITDRNLISPGYNEVTIESQPYTAEKDGAGIMVIYDDGSGNARIQLRDGIDMAYHGFSEPERKLTVPQTFTFPPLNEDRSSRLSLFFGSVSPNEPRSSIFTVTVDSTAVLVERNLLGSNQGAQWDSITLDFDIPAGASSVTVEAVSPPDVEPNGASFSWLVSSFYLLEPIPEVAIRKFTNGADANDPNGSDVPIITPGASITWTYLVTNTGVVTLTRAEVAVTDDQQNITPTLDINSDDGDELLAPGETWLYVATGIALNLSVDAENSTVVEGCIVNGESRPTYRNIGTVTIRNTTASDPSHYCNPPITPRDIDEEQEPTIQRYYMPLIAKE